MNNRALFIALSSSVLLSSCVLAPGSNLQTRNKEVIRVEDEHCFSINCRVKVYPLTPKLVQLLKPKKPRPHSNKALQNKIRNYEYRIGKGDILAITVWDHPELTIPAGSYRSSSESGNWVQADGSIFYPYIGKVNVEHKTIPEVQQIISNKLSKYIEKPQVSVSVASFLSQKVYITGEVNRPGVQPITNVPLTVLDAINRAEGLSQDVDWKNVSLTHKGKKRKISLYKLMQYGDLRQNALLTNDDIIHVPRDDNQKVFIMGEVQKPQTVKLNRDGLSLSEAMATAGGIHEQNAKASGIFVIRPINKGFSKNQKTIANIYQLNVKDAASYVLGTEFQLQPHDVIYVTAAPLTMWNRVLNQLLPTISAFSLLDSRSVFSISRS